MLSRRVLDGPLFAIVTPFGNSGSINYSALKMYLAFLEEQGVKNVLVNGTTGEFASMTMQERKELLLFVRWNWKGTIVNHVSATAVGGARLLIN